MTAGQWTPYALEGARRALLWRQRLVALLVGALVTGGGLSLIVFGTSTEQVLNLRGGGNTVSFERPPDPFDRPDATITLRPGGVNVVDEAIGGGSEDPAAGGGAPPPRGSTGTAEPVSWGFLFAKYGPVAGGLGVAALLLRGRSRRSLDMVNFGIFKGSMPMELISHRHRKLVLTTRTLRANPFGAPPGDLAPDEFRPWDIGRAGERPP